MKKEIIDLSCNKNTPLILLIKADDWKYAEKLIPYIKKNINIF